MPGLGLRWGKNGGESTKTTEPAEADRELEIGVTGYGGWGSVTNSPPGQWVRRNVEINDTLTWTRGRHTINAGAL